MKNINIITQHHIMKAQCKVKKEIESAEKEKQIDTSSFQCTTEQSASSTLRTTSLIK